MTLREKKNLIDILWCIRMNYGITHEKIKFLVCGNRELNEEIKQFLTFNNYSLREDIDVYVKAGYNDRGIPIG